MKIEKYLDLNRRYQNEKITIRFVIIMGRKFKLW